jgi:hypothetical protein
MGKSLTHGPACQRLCRHTSCPDWLAGSTFSSRPCLKGAVPTTSHACLSAPPCHFVRASPSTGRVITPPPFAVLLAAALLPPVVAHVASSPCAGHRRAVPFERLRSRPSTPSTPPSGHRRAMPSKRLRSQPSTPSAPRLLRPMSSPRCRCLSSCVVSAVVLRVRVHAEAPLPGDPPLLSATALQAAVQHRCVLRSPPRRASAWSRACQLRGPA